MDKYVNELYKYLSKGKKNAIHQKELASKLGITPEKLKRTIKLVRQNGLLDICSGNEGYWIAIDDNERKEFEEMLRKQALTRLKTTKPIRDALKRNNAYISQNNVLEDKIEEENKYEQI